MMYRWMEPQTARAFLILSVVLLVTGVAVMKGLG